MYGPDEKTGNGTTKKSWELKDAPKQIRYDKENCISSLCASRYEENKVRFITLPRIYITKEYAPVDRTCTGIDNIRLQRDMHGIMYDVSV